MRTCPTIFIAAALAITATNAQQPEPMEFHARDAKIAKTGGGLRFENGPGQQNLGVWDNTNAVVSWTRPALAKGTYRVIAVFSCIALEAGGEFEVTVGNQRAGFTVPATGGWLKFHEADLGPVIIRKPGPAQITARVTRIVRLYGINIRAIKLVPDP